jgi:hypothetical protein
VTSDHYGHLFPQARQALADSLDATYRAASDTRSTDSRGADVVQIGNAASGRKRPAR